MLRVKFAIVVVFILMNVGHTEAIAWQGATPIVDNQYLPPEISSLAVVRPAELTKSELAAWMPMEVLSASGNQYLGFDPLKLKSAIVFSSKLDLVKLPEFGIVLRFSEPTELQFPGIQPETVDGVVQYRGLPNGMVARHIDDSTLVVATETYVTEMLEFSASQNPIIQALETHPPRGPIDIYLDVDSNREFILAVTEQLDADVPPPAKFLMEIPALLSGVRIHQETDDDFVTEIAFTARGPEEAVRLSQIVDAGLTMGRLGMLSELQSSLDANDATQASLIAYLERVTNLSIEKMSPQIQGNDVIYRLPNIAVAAGVMAGAMAPAIQQSRVAATRVKSANNLRQLGLAILNYHDAYGHFPVGIRDPQGRPLLSWRVQVLPFLEELELYERFKLDEAWDSPDNQVLLDEMPEVFRSDLPGVESWQAVYQAVAGSQQIFNGRLTSITDIKDGMSGTAMLVETNAESVAVWTSPYDSRIQREDPFVELRREDVLGFNVLMADGAVRTISFGVSNEDWWGATTMAGGEIVNIGDDE